MKHLGYISVIFAGCSKMENLKHLEELAHLQVSLEFLGRIVVETNALKR